MHPHFSESVFPQPAFTFMDQVMKQCVLIKEVPTHLMCALYYVYLNYTGKK